MKEGEKRFKVIYTQGAMTCILFDEITGINYLFYNGGLTPLLDSNGNVVISKK